MKLFTSLHFLIFQESILQLSNQMHESLVRTSFLGAASASKGKRLDFSDRVWLTMHVLFSTNLILINFLFLFFNLFLNVDHAVIFSYMSWGSLVFFCGWLQVEAVCFSWLFLWSKIWISVCCPWPLSMCPIPFFYIHDLLCICFY
jgi:hypothetical protein